MAFMSIDDPDFWGKLPEEFRNIIEEEGVDDLNLSYFELGKREDNAPAVISLRMAPGYVLPRHTHNCYRFEIVVRGSLDIGDRVLTPGSIMISEPGVLYGPHVAGPEGCVTFEIFSTHDASHATMVEGAAGELEVCDLWTPEGARKMAQNAREQAAAFAK